MLLCITTHHPPSYQKKETQKSKESQEEPKEEERVGEQYLIPTTYYLLPKLNDLGFFNSWIVDLSNRDELFPRYPR